MEKILVVNNDFDTMELLKSWLEKKMYKVKFTGNGSEVEYLIKDFKPNLVIVDILQSAIANKLTKDEKNGVPILLMTGYTTANDTIQNIKADDIIQKPFDLELLEKKIKKLVNGKA